MKDYVKHIVKYEYEDGKKLPTPDLWCGAKSGVGDFHFTDAQHAALTVEQGGRLVPCSNCCKEIVKNLKGEKS